MSYFSRAEHLLQKPCLARLIQIVSIVKQSVAADEVFVLRPILNSGSALPILWQDRVYINLNKTENSSSSRRQAILSHEELVALSTVQKAMKHLDIEYYQDGCLWPRAEVDDGCVQALRLQYLIAGKGYLLIWARGKTNLFNKNDRKTFISLCETIATSDEDSTRDPKPQFANNGHSEVRESTEPSTINLTHMEDKVFQLLKQGFTEKAMAQRLCRSRHTIHSHVRVIYRKLSVNSKKELIEKVRQIGVL